MRVSRRSRRIAEQIDRERSSIERVGLRFIRPVGIRLRTSVVDAFVAGDDPSAVVSPILRSIQRGMVDILVTAHVRGRIRARLALRSVQASVSELERLPPPTDAVSIAKRLAGLDDGTIKALRELYDNEAADTIAAMTVDLEGRVRNAAARAVRGNLTVREGAKVVRAALGTGSNLSLAETIFRTQVQVAHGAGRWNANQDPDLDEIIWGYEYVTVGDDRVRANHAALEGAREPKGSPFWQRNWPPNGWSCRCTALEVFKRESRASAITLPSEVIVNGVPVVPGADEGWSVNFGTVFRDAIPLGA